MASSGRTLTVYLAADTRKAQAQLGLFGNALKGLKSIAGPALLAGAAYGLVEFGKSAVGAASDLAEVSSKVDVLFGDQAATVKAWSESANTAMGQTQTQALDAASTFAVLGKAANLSGTELGTFSMDLTSLASDLASFNNINPADAVLKLGAALRGEAEPARSMGILINQAATESKALELGLIQAGEAMSSQAAIMARYQLILEQSTDAQGDFERTSDGIANQSRITEATISELSTTFGTSFVAAASEAEYGQKDLNEALEAAKPLFEAAGKAAGNYAAQVINAAGAAGEAVSELSKQYEEQAWWAKTLSYTWHILSTPLDQLITETVTLGKVTDGAASDTAALSGKQYQLGAAYDYAAARAAANANAVANAARVAAAAAGQASAASSTWNSGYVTQAQQANELSKRLKAVAAAADAANKSTGGGGGGGGGGGAAGVNAAQEKRKQLFQDQASALQDQVRELDALTKGWQAAKKQMDDYASSIQEAITSQISLASAWQAQQDDQAKEAGEQTGVTWLQAFQQQIADSKALGEALKGLAAQPGVSQALVDQVAGVANSAGVNAATELVKGITGTEGLGAQLSTDLASSMSEAGSVGSLFAQNFYGAGVISANKLVQGMVDTVKESKDALRKLGKAIGEPIADEILKAIRAALAEARVANRGTAGVSSFGATPTLTTTSSSGSGAVRGAYQGSPSITIQTGVGDPVRIAREIQRVLAQGQMRTGGGA